MPDEVLRWMSVAAVVKTHRLARIKHPQAAESNADVRVMTKTTGEKHPAPILQTSRVVHPPSPLRHAALFTLHVSSSVRCWQPACSAVYFTAVGKRPAPTADHPPLHHGVIRIQPPAHTPPPQARADQEDVDEERLGWFVRQLHPDIISDVITLEGDAFAGTRKRLVQQRFERVGCPTSKHGLHRSFQGPIHAWKVTVGDLLAEQGFDWGGKVAVMGPSYSFACAGQAPTARLSRAPGYDKTRAAILSDSCSLTSFPLHKI